MRKPYTSEDRLTAFLAKVSKTNGCWFWRASRAGTGGPMYGIFWDGARMVYAHRWSYEKWVGPIPSGLQVDHLCREPLCVNPSHLEAVTPSVNTIRTLPHRKPRRMAASPEQVREALEATEGRVQDAANLLGISRVHFWRLRRTSA